MPLLYPSTIARDKVILNVVALQKEGMERNAAILTAFNAARKNYFKRYPHGLLPQWLAYPSRHAKDYLPSGAPIRRDVSTGLESNPRRAKSTSPATSFRRSALQAKRLYEGFREEEADFAETIEIPDFKIGVAPGVILGIIYETRIAGKPKKFIHEFRKVSSRPLLVVSHDGKQFRSVGGHFQFTDRGFVDK